MKRLLLPLLAALALPTAVNANPFSGNITYKDKYGDKVTILKKSIELKPFDAEEGLKHMKRINHNLVEDRFKIAERKYKELIENMEPNVKKCEETKEYKLYNKEKYWCLLTYKPADGVLRNKKKEVANLKSKVYQNKMKYKQAKDFFEANPEPAIHWVRIRYNWQSKTKFSKKMIDCPNPELTSTHKFYYNFIDFVEDYETVSIVCKKLAKFK